MQSHSIPVLPVCQYAYHSFWFIYRSIRAQHAPSSVSVCLRIAPDRIVFSFPGGMLRTSVLRTLLFRRILPHRSAIPRIYPAGKSVCLSTAACDARPAKSSRATAENDSKLAAPFIGHWAAAPAQSDGSGGTRIASVLRFFLAVFSLVTAQTESPCSLCRRPPSQN